MSQKIIDYDVINTDVLEELIEFVTAKIAEGWQPFGSMTMEAYTYRMYAMADSEQRTMYYQPMVKYVAATPLSVSDYERMKEQAHAVDGG